MSNLFFYLIIFLFGLIAGSFLNCVIYRLDKKESFIRGRSYCPNCKHKLSWQDLIPLLSFIELRGKCRYCRKPISFQYPLVELVTGILFVGVFHITFPNFLFSIFHFLISSLLIIVFVYDLKHYIIPDAVILPAIVIAFLYQIFNLPVRIATRSVTGGQFSIFNPILSALGASVFFLLIFLVSRGKWLGFGDVKLGFFMGLFLGFPNILVALFLGFFIGAIIGIGLVISGKKTLKSEVPFGPFLVAGTFIALFWSNNLISWYLNSFLL